MKARRIQAIYKNKVFEPQKDPGIPEGIEVTLLVLPTGEIPPEFLPLIEAPPFESFRGILKDLKEDSVSLQHKAKSWWK